MDDDEKQAMRHLIDHGWSMLQVDYAEAGAPFGWKDVIGVCIWIKFGTHTTCN